MRCLVVCQGISRVCFHYLRSVKADRAFTWGTKGNGSILSPKSEKRLIVVSYFGESQKSGKNTRTCASLGGHDTSGASRLRTCFAHSFCLSPKLKTTHSGQRIKY